MEEENKRRGPGRPRMEETMHPEWYNIMIDAGREGKHITQFLIELGMSWETHYSLLKRNKKYLEAFNEYQKLCEQWWYNKAHESIANGDSNRFNQRLWTIIMKNKFKNNWQDEKQVDITSKGEKISQDNKIEIEIIKTKNGRTDEDSVE
jgi:hypothetical protein